MRCGPGTIQVAFDVKNAHAIDWAKKHAAQLVTNISEQTREAIRSITSRGLAEGISVQEQARIIRGVVGLTDRDVNAALNLRKKLVKKGLGPREVENAVRRYTDKKLRLRAKDIARHSTMEASNEGQLQMWKQAQNEGLLDRRARREWIATSGACPKCNALNGKTAPIDGSFESGVTRPPRHNRCRCTTALSITARAKKAA